jgi:hypothetical protein
MAVLSTYYPTLLDVAKRLDPNGSIADVAEILTQYNEVLDDLIMLEGNLPTGHQITVRTNKPTVAFRLANKGVVPVKSATGQVVETIGVIEARSEIDTLVAELNGNVAAFRDSESLPIIQSMNDLIGTTLIYGDTSVNAEQFNGLASRYFGLTASTCPTTYTNVIDGGGTGSDNTSVYLVVWGPQTVFGIYPKGSKAGLYQEDLGKQDVITDFSTGAKMRAWVKLFQWKCGLCIKDWRAVVRIANIDVSNLLTAGDSTDTSLNLFKKLSQAIDKIPPNVQGRKVFYMNETVRSMLRVKMLDKSNNLLRMDDLKNLSIPRPDGVLTFMGIPCRRIDAITNAETALT